MLAKVRSIRLVVKFYFFYLSGVSKSTFFVEYFHTAFILELFRRSMFSFLYSIAYVVGLYHSSL